MRFDGPVSWGTSRSDGAKRDASGGHWRSCGQGGTFISLRLQRITGQNGRLSLQRLWGRGGATAAHGRHVDARADRRGSGNRCAGIVEDARPARVPAGSAPICEPHCPPPVRELGPDHPPLPAEESTQTFSRAKHAGPHGLMNRSGCWRGMEGSRVSSATWCRFASPAPDVFQAWLRMYNKRVCGK